MNRVIEISEIGPNDGETLTLPVNQSSFARTVLAGDPLKCPPVRVEYVDSGRKNKSGASIFVRSGKERAGS